MTPASPCTGSSSTAAVRGVMASRSAAASPYFTVTKPGVNGPKSARAVSSVENDTIVVVRPWKFEPATMISAVPSGTPLTRCAHLRAILTADSTASAPEFIGSTSSVPVSSASSRQNSPSWSWWNARDVSVTRPSCATAAAIRSGWRCPKFSAE